MAHRVVLSWFGSPHPDPRPAGAETLDPSAVRREGPSPAGPQGEGQDEGIQNRPSRSARRERNSVARAHRLEPRLDMIVDPTETRRDQRNERVPQKRTADHPLEVRTPTMRVGPVELALRHSLFEPAEESLVLHVHAERDLRLASIAAEMSLADEQSDQQASRVVVEPGGHHGILGARLFHRQVSRGTDGCFTVVFLVKNPGLFLATARRL